MRTEFVDGEYILRLSRPELVQIISGLTTADERTRSDLAFMDYVGSNREDFRTFVSNIAKFCRSVPFTYEGPSVKVTGQVSGLVSTRDC